MFLGTANNQVKIINIPKELYPKEYLQKIEKKSLVRSLCKKFIRDLLSLFVSNLFISLIIKKLNNTLFQHDKIIFILLFTEKIIISPIIICLQSSIYITINFLILISQDIIMFAKLWNYTENILIVSKMFSKAFSNNKHKILNKVFSKIL